MNLHLELIRKSVGNFIRTNPSKKLINTINVIKQNIISGNYSLSFNGGKDCTALLYLILWVMMETLEKAQDFTLNCIYIVENEPFPEVENFILDCEKHLPLSIERIESLKMREAFQKYLELHPNVQIIFDGTRRTDPHSEFLPIQGPTTGNWPRFLRVSPLIDWSYQEIWAFLKQTSLPYCSLYDKGYTSLGSKLDTVPNMYLSHFDGSFSEASLLLDYSTERAGRL